MYMYNRVLCTHIFLKCVIQLKHCQQQWYDCKLMATCSEFPQQTSAALGSEAQTDGRSRVWNENPVCI